jgi:hypothetical protein
MGQGELVVGGYVHYSSSTGLIQSVTKFVGSNNSAFVAGKAVTPDPTVIGGDGIAERCLDSSLGSGVSAA